MVADHLPRRGKIVKAKPRSFMKSSALLIAATGLVLVIIAGCAGGGSSASQDGPFDMNVRIATEKNPGDPSDGPCAYQVTELGLAQIRAESFQIQDGQGNFLGKGVIGVPHSQGDLCAFDSVVPGVPAEANYQIVVKLHMLLPDSPVSEARKQVTADEARSGKALLVVSDPG